MSLFLDRIDSAPIVSGDFDPQFLQWLWVLIDTLNETIGDVQNAFNYLTAPGYAMLTETVTLTSGLPTFTVVDGSLYNVGDNVIGNGIPDNTNILSITLNTITLDSNATITGSSVLVFIPTNGVGVTNGIVLYDTTTNVYVGMQNGALVQFTTTAYP
jgi:hypothetical protein